MAVVLRSFLYLDEALTVQYLAQLESGVYDEESEETVTGRGRAAEAGGRLGPLEAKGGRTGTTQSTTSRTVQQTPESRYSRLENLLDEHDGLQWLEAFDEEIWTGLTRGEMLQVEASLDVPSLFKAIDMAESAEPVMDLLEALGEVDDEAREAVGGLRALSGAMKRLTVVAKPVGTPRFKFICPLDPEYLRGDLGQMTGECRVVGTLARRLKSTEKYSLLDSIGLSGLPRDERRQAERDMKKSMPDSVISAPAAIMTPLAIYR